MGSSITLPSWFFLLINGIAFKETVRQCYLAHQWFCENLQIILIIALLYYSTSCYKNMEISVKKPCMLYGFSMQNCNEKSLITTLLQENCFQMQLSVIYVCLSICPSACLSVCRLSICNYTFIKNMACYTLHQMKELVSCNIFPLSFLKI